MAICWLMNLPGEKTSEDSGRDTPRTKAFEHPVAHDKADTLDLCIPLAIHGDEGRGKLKRAIMVYSIQPMLHATSHSYNSRFLYTCVPAESYASDATCDLLQMEMVSDLQEMYEKGLEESKLIYVVKSGYLCSCVICASALSATASAIGIDARWHHPKSIFCIDWSER